MKNKVIIIVLIVLALAAGGGYMAYNNWYNSTEHQVELAEEMIVNGNHEEALATYEMLVTREPENVGFAQKVCDEKIALGKHSEAISDLRVLLSMDQTKVENWDKLLSESELAGIPAIDLGTLYVEAYEVTKNKAYQEWIQEHQPVMPVFSKDSGDYKNLYRIAIEGEDFDIEVTHDGEKMDNSYVNGTLMVDHGKTVVTVKKTSPWGFSDSATYEYTINNIVEFKNAKFGRLFRSLTGMDEIRYKDLEEFNRLTLMGDHLYLKSKRNKEYGIDITSTLHGGYEYGNLDYDVWYYNRGSINSSEDLALFPNIEYLMIGMQADGFSQGLEKMNVSKLHSLKVFAQNDFSQDLFELKAKEANMLGYVWLHFTPVNDVNVLADSNSIYQVFVNTKIDVSFDLVDANPDIHIVVHNY